MTLKVVICDDFEKARDIIKRYLEILNIREIEIIGEAQNGMELIDICKETHPDVILLDVDMPVITGIDAAKKIVEFLPKVSFIFITAHPSFAIDYILKPVSIERLEKSIRHIISKRSEIDKNIQDDIITFSSSHEVYSINQKDIFFIERDERKTIVHILLKPIVIYESLDSIQVKLDSDLFIRTHRSYLVNKLVISKVGNPLGRVREIVFKNYDKPAYISRKSMSKLEKLIKVS